MHLHLHLHLNHMLSLLFFFQSALAAVPGVRDVHPQRRLTRALAWYDRAGEAEAPPPPQPAGNASASFDFASTGGAAFLARTPGSTTSSILKRPGRLTTAPTLGLGGHGDADPSFPSPSRSLLAANSPGVAAALAAPALWARGITGTGVRVGIFDTGVKGDHPHIKNIR